jgi:cytochrome P450
MNHHHLGATSFFQSSPMACTTTTAATVLFAVVTFIASVVWWRWWQHQQREKQQKKSGTVFPPVGPAFSDLTRCLRAENQIITMQKYGSIFCVPSPLPGIIPHQVVTTDITILKELCITQFNQYREPCTFITRVDGFRKAVQQVVGVGVTGLKGDEWKWRKQALIKEFHRSKLLSDNNSRGLVTKIVKEGKELCDAFHKAAANREAIAVDHVTTKAAVRVILFVLFGRDDWDFDTEPMRQSAKDLMACLRARTIHPFYKLYQYIPGTLPFEMERRKRIARKIVDDLIAPEILMLLDEHAGKRPVHEHRKGGSVLASLIANEPRFVHGGVHGMIDEARVFFLAGFDTTSHSLAFCMGMMAERPDLATQMATLGKSILDKNDIYNVDVILKSLENDDDAAILAIKNFFLESVRLYPLVPALGGECIKDVAVTTSNGKTVHLAKGTMVIFPNIPLQRQLDNSPDSIIPERWNVPASQQPFLHTFQTGAHACPGRPLSMLEGQVFLLLVATQFEFAFPPGIEKVEYEENLLLRPKNDMPLLVQKRQL